MSQKIRKTTVPRIETSGTPYAFEEGRRIGRRDPAQGHRRVSYLSHYDTLALSLRSSGGGMLLMG